MLRLTSIRGRWTILVLVGTAVLFPVLAPAEDLPDKFRKQLATDRGRQAVDSLDFLLTLSLTAEQAQRILPLYEESCRIHTEAYDLRAEIHPAELEAYSAFLEEDRLNQGFSPEVERETAQVSHRAKQSRERVIGELNALAGEVWSLLSPEQQAAAAEYQPNKQTLRKRFTTPQDQRKAARRAKRRARPARHQPPRHGPELDEAQKELRTINRAVHAHLEPIAKYLLTPAAAEHVYPDGVGRAPRAVRGAAECWQHGNRDYPRAQCDRDEQEIHKLRKEINHWNLANGMHFSLDQIEELVRLADEVRRSREERRQAKPKKRRSQVEFSAALVRLELEAEAVLRPGQAEVLAEYKPCMIPPKNLKDPVRVGQASDSARHVSWLKHARSRRPRQVDAMIERLIAREGAHLGPLDETAAGDRRALLKTTVQKASKMTDVEFALNQDDLAAEIEPQDRKRELTADIDTIRRRRAQPGRTSQFLLNPGFAEVLKVRYAQLAEGAGQ